MINFIAGSLLTFLHLLLIIYCASAWAIKLLPAQPAHVRLSAASIGAWWLAGLVFAILIPLALFDRTVVTLLLCAIAGLTAAFIHRPRPVADYYAHLLTAAKSLWRTLPLWLRIATAAVLAVLAVRMSRGIIAPPLAWDALTYHLLKAGRWVQSGRWIFDNAPDSWQSCEWFPPLGDVYFAWAMLGTHTDAWLAWLGTATWFNCALAVYALARTLDFDQTKSWLAAITTVAAPATLAFITANYVDNTALAIVTLGSALLISGVRQKSTMQLAIATIAMGLAVGIKITFLPYLLVSLTLLPWYGITQRHIKTLPLALLALLPCLSWQGWLISQGHTPFYPAPFSILGLQIEPGQPEFVNFTHSDLDLSYAYELPTSMLRFLHYSPSYAPGHSNFTVTFPIVLLVGLLGCYQGLKTMPWRSRIAFGGLLAAGLSILVSFWLPETSYYRAVWVENLARFFSAFYALLIIGLLYLWNPAWKYLFATLIVAALYEAWPKAWVSLDYQSVAIGMVFLLIAIATGWFLLRGNKLALAIGLAVISGTLLLAGTSYYRSIFRYKFYSSDEVYDVYYPKTLPYFIDAAKLTDGQTGKTIAFSIGHEDIAYRWFRYVFLGSQLQNSVVYVTNTDSGKVWSPAVDQPPPVFSYQKWLKRLKNEQVDYFFSTVPYPVEALWTAEHRKKFSVTASSAEREWILLAIK